MAGICANIPTLESLSWASLEAGAKYLTTPKPYLKIGESVFLWGKYVLPPVASHCEAVASLIKSAIAPIGLLEAVSSGCKLRSYVIELQDGKDRGFEEIFSNGVINVSGFAGNVCKSVSWLCKMNLLVLAEVAAFRVGVAGAVCLLAKSSMDLVVKTMTILPILMTGEEVELDLGVKYAKAMLGTVLAVLTLCAIYQATATGAFLSLLLGSCSNLLDVLT